MKKISKLVIATRNPGKKERYGRLFSGVANKVLSLEDLGIKEKPEESGETAEENAEMKAKFYARKTGLPVFSEDESLFVDFLPSEKQPGVYIRRVNGRDEVNDDKLLKHWNSIVAKVPEGKRTGRWHTAYCFALPNGKVNTVAVDYKRVFFSPPSKIRIPGWPLSSLQGPVEFRKPHTELTKDELKSMMAETDRILKERLKKLFKEVSLSRDKINR